MKSKTILFLSILTMLIGCKDNTPDEQDVSMALPHSKDLPEQTLSEVEKQKLVDATGKNVEKLSFMTFQNLLNSNDKDKLYIYNFWATYCKPCVEEMPYFEALQKAYPDKVEIIFVSLDDPNKIEEEVLPFVRENKIVSEVILLEKFGDAEIQTINENWDGGIPATLFVNQKRSVRDFRQQGFSFGELKAVVSPYLMTVD